MKTRLKVALLQEMIIQYQPTQVHNNKEVLLPLITETLFLQSSGGNGNRKSTIVGGAIGGFALAVAVGCGIIAILVLR